MGHTRRLLPVEALERLPDLPTQRRPPGGSERRVERVLVEHVDEAIAQVQRVVGELGLTRKLDERVNALQVVQPLFDLVRRKAQHPSDDRRVEHVALHARRGEQLAIVLAELPDLALDHRPHGLRQLALDLRQSVLEVPLDRPPPRSLRGRAGSARGRP